MVNLKQQHFPYKDTFQGEACWGKLPVLQEEEDFEVRNVLADVNRWSWYMYVEESPVMIINQTSPIMYIN